MIARGFRSVGWVAGIAATALGCYMVNLKVASERAALEDVETRIVLAQRDIRLLQTEIGTRGRLAQLEKWNVKVLALSAPQANQFLEGSFQLATLMRPDEKIDPAAPVVLASAPAPRPAAPVMNSDGPMPQEPVQSRPAAELMHVASLKVREPKPVAMPLPDPKKAVAEAPRKSLAAAAAAKKKAVEKQAKLPPSATAGVKPAKPAKDSAKIAEVKPKPKPKPKLASVTPAKTKSKEATAKQ